ncbi:hypothetical protein [Lampropedia aestuarii]|uniref:hypothetical protein n=1 Tax=Lampropedia aestuarii TaxID=2562762 RepID=UPI002469337E|nr:hypothetical protein [Lampropedia aestuarii]MDH5856732.1 hypothetical protein [Lampropedia aestuarii]
MDNNGREFHYSIKSWDNRLPNLNLTEGAYFDPDLDSFYIGSHYAEDTNFLSLMRYSHSANGDKGNDFKWYGLCISKEELALAVQEMNSKSNNPNSLMDTDISNYTVTSVELTSEIGNLPTAIKAGGAGWYTSRFSGIYFYTEY